VRIKVINIMNRGVSTQAQKLELQIDELTMQGASSSSGKRNREKQRKARTGETTQSNPVW